MEHGEQLDLFDSKRIQPREIQPGVDICVSRHRGADTSREAFQATPESTRQRQRDRVLAFIRQAGDHGATCEEASQGLGIAYTAASARLTQLQVLNAVRFGTDRRQTAHGRSARVYYAAH